MTVCFNVFYNVLLGTNASSARFWIVRTGRGYGGQTVPEAPTATVYA